MEVKRFYTKQQISIFFMYHTSKLPEGCFIEFQELSIGELIKKIIPYTGRHILTKMLLPNFNINGTLLLHCQTDK